MESVSTTPPRLQFAARSNAAIQFKSGPPDVADYGQFPKYPGSVLMEYSNNDGKLVAVITAQNVVIHNSDTGAVVHTLAQPGVAKLLFSPKNNFLLTWERWTKEKQAANKGNLIIWDLKTGEQAANFIQKTVDDETWPPIRWTDDEAISARMVSTEIQFFAGSQWSRASHALKLPGVTHFSLAPQASPPLVAAFVPAKAGKPGSVKIFRYPNFERGLASKTFFNATNVEFNWNATGTAVLAKTRSDVDKSNKSYLGESGISYLSVDGSSQVQISLDKEGPIHEISWSPDGKQFILIYGFMPAKVALFDSNCKKTADFYPAGAPRNTARWTPCGQVLCLGGFGNLSGYMDFWHVKKLRKLGEARAAFSAYCAWSPDSNYLLTAVLSPKMTVDNGIKIFKPDGTIVYEQPMEKLYQVEWRPYLPNVFPTPRFSLPHGVAAEKEPKPGLYRHPNFSDDGRHSEEQVLGPQKISQEKQRERPEGYIPSKSAQKNKKRRDRKKKKQGQAQNGASSPDSEQKLQQQPQVTSGPTAAPTQTGQENQDIIKQIKAIKKKLRQIKDLKEKSPETLDVTQKEKIAREDDLQKQLALLQQKLPPRT